jgi:GNAT superfamily N-acetyltransferase
VTVTPWQVFEANQWCHKHLNLTLTDTLDLLGRGTGCSEIARVAVPVDGHSLTIHAIGKRDEVVWERKFKIFPHEKILCERIAVAPGWKRRGIGQKLNRNLRELMERSGSHILEARATTPGGSYFCARCGFLPTNSEWPNLRLALRDRIFALQSVQPAMVTELDTAIKDLESDNPTAIRRLFSTGDANITRPESDEPTTMAHAILEIHRPAWSAILDFKVRESLLWFERCVGGRFV